MTLDEAIKHAEEVAKQNEEDAVIYSNCKNHKKNLYEIGLAENAEKKCCKCAEEHRRLAEWLKELKRLRNQTRWIPCKERLPEIGQLVLCTIPTSRYFGSVKVCRYHPADKHESVPYFDWNENGFPTAVAWMPLPTPWEGEKDDGETQTVSVLRQ